MPNYITLLTSRSMNSEHFEHQMLVTISDDVTSGKLSDNVASSKYPHYKNF
jgi:hypothetical protein